MIGVQASGKGSRRKDFTDLSEQMFTVVERGTDWLSIFNNSKIYPLGSPRSPAHVQAIEDGSRATEQTSMDPSDG